MQVAPDELEGQIEYRRHDEDEHRQGGVLAGEYAVDPAAADVLAALLGLRDRLPAYLFYKRVTHIRDGGVAVEPALLLHAAYDVLQHMQLFIIELQRFLNERIALDQL